jgi:CDP-diacylglycerol--glycerol-3-phosphate 3-phosphatidyltransferase
MSHFGGWANRITLARGVLAVGLCVVLETLRVGRATDASWWMLAFALFVVGAVTDVLDGWIARSRGEVSVFGRIADPFVDKLLILGTGVFLVAIPRTAEVLPAWVVAVLLAREMLVTALRAAVEGRGGNFQAGWTGKLKMVLQCVAIAAVLLHGAGVGWVDAPIAGPVTAVRTLVFAAAAVTAASGAEYAARAWRVLGGGPSRA